MSYKKENLYTVTLEVAKNITASSQAEAIMKASAEITERTDFDVCDTLDCELQEIDPVEDVYWGEENDA